MEGRSVSPSHTQTRDSCQGTWAHRVSGGNWLPGMGNPASCCSRQPHGRAVLRNVSRSIPKAVVAPACSDGRNLPRHLCLLLTDPHPRVPICQLSVSLAQAHMEVVTPKKKKNALKASRAAEQTPPAPPSSHKHMHARQLGEDIPLSINTNMLAAAPGKADAWFCQHRHARTCNLGWETNGFLRAV